MSARKYLTDLSRAECQDLAVRLGGAKFHGKILFKWIFFRGAKDLDEMTDLPLKLRKNIDREYKIHPIQVVEEHESQDGTKKILYQLPDLNYIESVRIPEGERVTLCISTQVGCAVGCGFCASGLKGLVRSLTVGEILAQVLLSSGDDLSPLTNIVFMGVGEPLMNFKNLSMAIQALNDPEGMGFGARRMTVSTVGLPEGIRKLADMGLQINLAISLHTALEEKRKQLIPLAEKISLNDLLESADYFRMKTTRDVTYEVLLLREVNDGLEDAQRLAVLLKGRKCLVNLIPFNPSRGIPFDAPSHNRVSRFRKVLEEARIPVTVRKPRGTDILAACGQLRMKAMEGNQE